jgi:hypothetical protein
LALARNYEFVLKAIPLFHLRKLPPPDPSLEPTVNKEILKIDVGWATDSAGDYKVARQRYDMSSFHRPKIIMSWIKPRMLRA